jgi:CBS domain containing-hemolysin-like protein
LPVYKDSPYAIVGVINMKDLLNLSINKGLIVLQDILYPPTFVAGSKLVVDLLKEFQKGHTHIAIVLDPKGAVEGLVTLEDILEEIVGEIEDEYDIRGTAKVVKNGCPKR